MFFFPKIVVFSSHLKTHQLPSTSQDFFPVFSMANASPSSKARIFKMINTLVRFISAKICRPRLFKSKLGSLIPCNIRRAPAALGAPLRRGMRCSKWERRNLGNRWQYGVATALAGLEYNNYQGFWEIPSKRKSREPPRQKTQEFNTIRSTKPDVQTCFLMLSSYCTAQNIKHLHQPARAAQPKR